MLSDTDAKSPEELIPGLQASSVDNTTQETGIYKWKVFPAIYNSKVSGWKCYKIEGSGKQKRIKQHMWSNQDFMLGKILVFRIS